MGLGFSFFNLSGVFHQLHQWQLDVAVVFITQQDETLALFQYILISYST